MYVLIQAFVWGFHTKVHPKTIHVYFHAFKTVLRSYSTQGIHYQIQIRASCEIQIGFYVSQENLLTYCDKQAEEIIYFYRLSAEKIHLLT